MAGTAGLTLSVLLLVLGCARLPGQEVPDVRTPLVVVNEMLSLAEVTADDTVYDLGSGDGRILIAAARDRGARGVGLEIDPTLVAQSTEQARRLGLADRLLFRQQDLFEADLAPATVVTLYLSPDLNRRLRPKLLRELRPGARVVSHNFDMGDWAPARTLRVGSHEGSHTIYLWVVPGR
ncbi:MAG TPA: methyltransferase domain-containing protein [Methylomirabilota bacterium]|nr:methyltransferase domain-containing protein [Methylomirabilota bacterium]